MTRNNNRGPRRSRGYSQSGLVEHSVYFTGSPTGAVITAAELGLPIARAMRLVRLKCTVSAPNAGPLQLSMNDGNGDEIYISLPQLAAAGQNTVVTGNVPIGSHTIYPAGNTVCTVSGDGAATGMLNTWWRYGHHGASRSV